ncbi:MAG: cobyric acid synthase CobQ, partial [Halomonadaceae bacterium]|nr:cobyric acid synthase CobQ [Halomonadaceae bacterium]
GELKARGDGAVSSDGQVMGTSVHGLFDRADTCEALLARCGLEARGVAVDYQAHRQRELDRLADCLEAHLDMSAIDQLLQL